MRSRDTTPEAHAVQIELFRRMGPSGRFERALEMSNQAREQTLAGIRRRHPEYDQETARFALFRLLLGDALFQRVWPRVPLVDP